MQQAFVQKHFHERTNSANSDQFAHQMLAAGFQIGEYGHAFADAREIVNRQFDFAAWAMASK